ncbi:hypothetical protein N7376_24155 [Brucella intermedia GD04153]|uniref:Uncharacterized protein n=1 Tax=Brucella intermedia GD04153 TaxID=2975438 RepID=A0AA42H1Q7_9HYPH|nr:MULTISPECIES: hypothetical protein [Brucella]MDH0127066.1 hypothetical protein [Brucella intermedia GD04153]
MENDLQSVTELALRTALSIADATPEERAELDPEMVAKADEIAALHRGTK